MADIAKDDRILVVDIDMDVIAIGSQMDIELQLIPATRHRRTVGRRGDGDRAGICCKYRASQNNQCKTKQHSNEPFHDILLE